jgi:predicted aspartyl protease
MPAKILSFTNAYSGFSRELRSDVSIAPAFDPATLMRQQPSPFKLYRGIWDTGATSSVITEKVVTELGLQPISMARVHHAHGQTDAEVYLVNIALPNNVAFAGVRVTKGELRGTDTLIGMDIIGRGDFAVSNYNGKTTFSFRIPSIACIDFTGKVPQTAPPKVERNDPCPCGSGKKYKKCCGK